MKEYRKVVDFKYKKNKYTMFIDNKDRYYFLKKDENEGYSYVDINTFLELGKLFSNPPHVLKAQKDGKIKMIPKVLIGSAIVGLTLSNINNKELQNDVNNSVYAEYINNVNTVEEYKTDEVIEVEENQDNKVKLTYYNEDSEDEFVIDTYYYFQFLDSLHIYDNDYLDKYITYDNITLEDMYKVLDANENINDYFKKLIKEYCKDYVTKYPNAERRILYENLKDLKVIECKDSLELYKQTLSDDALACYVKTENTIYTMEGYQYIRGTWDYQVLYHELSHASRELIRYDGQTEVVCEPDSINFSTITSIEALNSLFAVSLYSDTEKDIAYQLQSNIFSILISNMDNYSIEDYMNHSLTYFVHQLDIAHNDNNYASVILEMIESQYTDYHDESIEIDQNEFYPLYDYISDFYYKDRINSNTTYDEAKGYTDELLEILLFDVPEEYNIDKNYFYEYLDIYCENLGIYNTSIKK